MDQERPKNKTVPFDEKEQVIRSTIFGDGEIESRDEGSVTALCHGADQAELAEKKTNDLRRPV